MTQLSRRGLLLGASALALTACSRGPAPLVTPTASPTGPVRAQLQAIMDAYAANTDLLGMTVKDLRSDEVFAFRGDFATNSASIAKVMIVLMALRKVREDGTELTFEQYGWASKAIMSSDNDAADALWEFAGGRDAYTRLAADLELPNTRGHADSEFWSWTHTCPDDQCRLVELLVRGTPVIHDEDRLYLVDLMSKTVASQTWGVGHDRGREVDVAMKNGWVQFRSIDNLWGVNSIGHVKGLGRDYVAAIMCRRETFDDGRALVDAIGADLFDVMGSSELR